MCVQLIKSEDASAEAIRVVQGDGGIDAHIGALSDPTGIHVFQAKYFKDGIGESQKGQIRESFRRVRENAEFKTKAWTLCTSVNMGFAEKKWFEGWAAEQSGSGITILPVWDEAKIISLLLKEKNKGIPPAAVPHRELTHGGTMGDRVWQVPQDLFVAAWNEAGSSPELSARLKEAAGGHIPGWAQLQRASELRKTGVEMKMLMRTVPLHA